MQLRVRPRRVLAVAALLGVGLPALLAAPTAVSIPLAPHGDGNDGSAGLPLPLTSTSFLVATEGPDGSRQTADDRILLTEGLGGALTVTPLATPFLSDFSGRLVRLSATRALAIAAGADGSFATADDVVFLLDELGSQNTVTPIVVGAISDSDGFVPEPLTASSAAMATRGPDLVFNTPDDTIALLTDLGGANNVTHLSAPRLHSNRGRPTALSPTSFLVPSNGPDGAVRTVDDQVFLFTDVGGANTRTDLTVPRLVSLGNRRPVRVTATRALFRTAGPDGVETNADDEMVLADGLGTPTITLTPITVPHAHDFGNGLPVPLSDTVVLLGGEGNDSAQQTDDDEIFVITGLGTTNTVTRVVVGPIDEDASSRPVRLTATSAAFCGAGPDRAMNSADDRLLVLSGIGTTNTLLSIPLPGVSFAATSVPAVLSNTEVLVGHGGPDGKLDAGLDDLISQVSFAGAPLVQSVPADAELDSAGTSSAPQPLGGGRAVCVASGPNGAVGSGGDDVVRVVGNLPTARGIQLRRLSFQFRAANPAAREVLSASGLLSLDDPALLLGRDLTVSLGNAAQTLPASLLKVKRNGTVEYRDPKARRGFITRLVLNLRKGQFSVAGRGFGTGVRTTSPGYLPVAIDGGDFYFADLGVGRMTGKGIRFP